MLKGPILFSHNGWDVCEMKLSHEKVVLLWERLKEHKTLFSDVTRGDFQNYVRLLVKPFTYWLEVFNGDDLLGIIYFDGLESPFDVAGEMMFFDRKPSEKKDLCKLIVKHFFDTFPVHRITVSPPVIYHGTIRLAKKIGFAEEGIKRESILIGGKWIDQVILGLTRNEVEDAIPSG